ncbi:ectoine/hydroxyectoine ABC transporter substrate-binding protein EhuB [Mangrovactinospora gilvigrisea]|uniref:Ectoine/hydroxyectoine ABC transporter substrate-binding protein EhuB n=1 Tax=Mangrovactinospora gilvigrisea TaxID=1428644 RepID=A0A1J7C9V7_9ACTN|nr:ectoine/hydroxyectoine ABC transporter substrate-binding protein EhuB [Mangrovactinospora gilvigrisea]OIV38312.1 ectoine/hydroxyectoine ABC transporter substrate-binding protein EhuB [Mangrovactinospora gilvigrisea]
MTDSNGLSRRGFLTRGAAVGGLIAVPALLTACSKTNPKTGQAEGQSTLQKARKQGYIKIGFAGEAPYGFNQGNTPTGEAPTLHKIIFKKLGIPEIHASVVDFDALIPSLNANKFDVVSAGMAITPERCAKVIFSEPEFIGPTALMVKKGNPMKLTDLASCAKANAKVGVLTAAVEDGYAKSAGVKSITTLPAQQDGLDALVAGRIDAFALTGISLNWLSKSGSNKGKPVQVLTPFVPEVKGVKQYSPGGAVFRKADTSLRDAFNKQLLAITGNPSEYVQLLGKYGFGNSEVPPKGLTTAKLCAGKA